VATICRILIVEDDPAVRQIFTMILANAGYDLLLAHDGPSMRNALGAGDVDVVIIDVMLPGSANGLALAQEAERDGCGVILVTGYHDLYQGVAESGYPYLFKPFRMSALTAMVAQVLRKTAARCQVKSMTDGD
jgi:DNA-binding response OmpR family regulator